MTLRDRLTPLPIPSRAGRIAVVTGANSGIGLATARALGQAGAQVVLAVRNMERGAAALETLRRDVPHGSFRTMQLDTSSLDSVGDFHQAFGDVRLDILICNAGHGAPRERITTADGNELTFATNYLGHFALVGRLLPNLRQASRARVVTLGSPVAQGGHLDFTDLQLERQYRPASAYANSKLAMVMFARELQRHSAAGDWGLNAHAAHPGWSDTAIFGKSRLLRVGIAIAGAARLAQSAGDGSQPIVFAAASRQAVAGAYYGPITRGGLAGPVGKVRLPRQARDLEALRRLWEASEDLTGKPFAAAS